MGREVDITILTQLTTSCYGAVGFEINCPQICCSRCDRENLIGLLSGELQTSNHQVTRVVSEVLDYTCTGTRISLVTRLFGGSKPSLESFVTERKHRIGYNGDFLRSELASCHSDTLYRKRRCRGQTDDFVIDDQRFARGPCTCKRFVGTRSSFWH